MIRVAVTGPALLCGALKGLLETDPRITVVALAPRPGPREGGADVLVAAGGGDWLGRSTAVPPAVLLIGAEPRAAERLRRLSPGAWGILPAGAPAAELTAAVMALAAGLVCAPPALLDPLMRQPLGTEGDGPDGREMHLSPRELQVLEAMARGRANKEIAWELGMSEHTVKFHTSAIYARLGASNRAEAVRVGIQSGLLLL